MLKIAIKAYVIRRNVWIKKEYSWFKFDSKILKIWPYEKNKNTNRDVSNADFLVFFNIDLVIIHITIVMPNIIKTGKIIPWIRIRWIFWEYTKNTGYNAIKIGWIIINFIEFSCNSIYRFWLNRFFMVTGGWVILLPGFPPLVIFIRIMIGPFMFLIFRKIFSKPVFEFVLKAL